MDIERKSMQYVKYISTVYPSDAERTINEELKQGTKLINMFPLKKANAETKGYYVLFEKDSDR